MFHNGKIGAKEVYLCVIQLFVKCPEKPLSITINLSLKKMESIYDLPSAC